MSFFDKIFNHSKEEGEYNRSYSHYNKDEGEQPFSSTIDTDPQPEQKATEQKESPRRTSRPKTSKRADKNLTKWLIGRILLIALLIAVVFFIKENVKRWISNELKKRDVPSIVVLDSVIPDVEVPEIEVEEEEFNYEEDLKRGLGLTNKESKQKNVVKDSSSESSVIDVPPRKYK